MWKWSDEASFLRERKLATFGISEQFVNGEFNIDTTTAPTVFLERLRATRRFFVESFLIQKFYRGLATVHNFRERSTAELSHRIRVQNDESSLILPTLYFHKSLDNMADETRATLLGDMEERGLPVTLQEWNRAYGGGDLDTRMKSAAEDTAYRLQAMKLMRLRTKVKALQENPDSIPNLTEQVDAMLTELKGIKFGQDQSPEPVAKMDAQGRKEATDMADGVAQDFTPDQATSGTEQTGQHFSVASVGEHIAPSTTAVSDNPFDDLSRDYAAKLDKLI
jgi:hypothetical protein